ncbi:MAG: hypothetical protein BJ554DRAFT_2749, partial [Olpidium bornovanus]
KRGPASFSVAEKRKRGGRGPRRCCRRNLPLWDPPANKKKKENETAGMAERGADEGGGGGGAARWLALESNPEPGGYQGVRVLRRVRSGPGPAANGPAALQSRAVPLPDHGEGGLAPRGANASAVAANPTCSNYPLPHKRPRLPRYENHRRQEEERIRCQGQVVSDKVFFIRQHIANACGNVLKAAQSVRFAQTFDDGRQSALPPRRPPEPSESSTP